MFFWSHFHQINSELTVAFAPASVNREKQCYHSTLREKFHQCCCIHRQIRWGSFVYSLLRHQKGPSVSCKSWRGGGLTVQAYSDTLYLVSGSDSRREEEECNDGHDSSESGRRLPSAYCQRRWQPEGQRLVKCAQHQKQQVDSLWHPDHSNPAADKPFHLWTGDR